MHRLRQATLIYNPHAGFDDWQLHIEATAQYWQAREWEVSLRQTEYPVHATELAAAAARAGHQLVLVAGGDGTIHEVANGLLGSTTVLAPLPAGTTNCLTRDLGLPTPGNGNPSWLLEASERLLAGHVQAMDVGECSNGRSFLLWAAVGLDSRIVESVEPRSRLLKRFGIAGYVAKATLPFLTYQGRHTRVSVDSESVEGDMLAVIVSNTRLYAGGLFNLSPQSVFDDGKLDVWILRGRYSPRMLLHSAFIVAGRHTRRPDIIHLSGRHVIVETDRPQPFHLDGELNRSTPIACTVEPGRLRILAPQGAAADLFKQEGLGLAQYIKELDRSPAIRYGDA
ncbi:MAG TPA: diacylglycerol kinase family lipid kinase [Chloroflexi bacterium]|nr:diacylglycerol kinase family lipid kinase [Chloroflexota bacterium]